MFRFLTLPAILVPSFLLLVNVAQAAPVAAALTSADVQYTVSHEVKTFEARLDPDHVSANVTIDPTAVADIQAEIHINPLGFNSDNRRRDAHALRSLEATLFPTVTYRIDGLEVVDEQPAVQSSERVIAGRTTGQLNLHGVTRDFPIDVEIRLEENMLSVSGSFTVLLEDFDIKRAKLFFIPIENEVPMEISMSFALPPQPTPAATTTAVQVEGAQESATAQDPAP